ncbi:baseplate J/gp47 family protein [Paenibacillus sp. 481]|uniref:baseplate J/gp47 family protein n=1 Tax=Paenibacillus sp. 481 TaxID=2835869 RepID=UPI001E3EE4A5|nr:baseplate J/gp47 family protein [Paenibacillus sp. 481]UHA71942.1 baseplate J/gp47 family protein [Paenibacillus sp. 481]
MLTKDGLKRKTYNEIYEEMVNDIRSKMGSDVNTTETSPLGMLMQVFAWHLSLLWEDVEHVYHGAYLNYAEGVQLDALAVFYGLRRKLEMPAMGRVELRGTPQFVVPAGYKVGTTAGVWFVTEDDCVLDATGIGSVAVMAERSGSSGNVAVGTIAHMFTPLVEVKQVTNPAATQHGSDRESDNELRMRLRFARDGSNAATVESIISALQQLPDVESAAVFVNDTMQMDARGVPPKSIQTYVYGGKSDEVAKAIFAKKAGGIGTAGVENVTVKDIGGSDHIIKFSRMTERLVHLDIQIEVNSTFSSHGVDEVKDVVALYIGGYGVQGQRYVGLPQGSKIVYTRLLAVIQGIAGVEDVTGVKIKLGDGPWENGNADIADFTVARVAPERVKVTVRHV